MDRTLPDVGFPHLEPHDMGLKAQFVSITPLGPQDWLELGSSARVDLGVETVAVLISSIAPGPPPNTWRVRPDQPFLVPPNGTSAQLAAALSLFVTRCIGSDWSFHSSFARLSRVWATGALGTAPDGSALVTALDDPAGFAAKFAAFVASAQVSQSVFVCSATDGHRYCDTTGYSGPVISMCDLSGRRDLTAARGAMLLLEPGELYDLLRLILGRIPPKSTEHPPRDEPGRATAFPSAHPVERTTPSGDGREFRDGSLKPPVDKGAAERARRKGLRGPPVARRVAVVAATALGFSVLACVVAQAVGHVPSALLRRLETWAHDLTHDPPADWTSQPLLRSHRQDIAAGDDVDVSFQRFGPAPAPWDPCFGVAFPVARPGAFDVHSYVGALFVNPNQSTDPYTLSVTNGQLLAAADIRASDSLVIVNPTPATTVGPRWSAPEFTMLEIQLEARGNIRVSQVCGVAPELGDLFVAVAMDRGSLRPVRTPMLFAFLPTPEDASALGFAVPVGCEGIEGARGRSLILLPLRAALAAGNEELHRSVESMLETAPVARCRAILENVPEGASQHAEVLQTVERRLSTEWAPSLTVAVGSSCWCRDQAWVCTHHTSREVVGRAARLQGMTAERCQSFCAERDATGSLRADYSDASLVCRRNCVTGGSCGSDPAITGVQSSLHTCIIRDLLPMREVATLEDCCRLSRDDGQTPARVGYGGEVQECPASTR